jgi:hypothetical protein
MGSLLSKMPRGVGKVAPPVRTESVKLAERIIS